MVKGFLSVICLVLIFSFQSCYDKKPSEKSVQTDTIPLKNTSDQSIPGSFSPPTKLVFDSVQVKLFTDSFPLFASLQKELHDFYSKRNYSFAWFDDKGMIEPADNLYNRIMNIRDEGLPDKILYKPTFAELMDAEADNRTPSPKLDLMLTAQYISYAKSVWSGLSKKEITSLEWL